MLFGEVKNVFKRRVRGIGMQEPQGYARSFEFPRVNRLFESLLLLRSSKRFSEERAHAHGERPKTQIGKKCENSADIKRFPPGFFGKRKNNRCITANLRKHLAKERLLLPFFEYLDDARRATHFFKMLRAIL